MNNYTQLTSDQLNEAYEYCLKKLIEIIHKNQSGYIFNKAALKLELHEILSKINQIRKAQNKPRIFTTKIHVGDVSFYLEFF